jgi:hypothetical protein
MAEERLNHLVQDLFSKRESNAEDCQGAIEAIKKELRMRSEARNRQLWATLAGSALQSILESRCDTERFLHDEDSRRRIAALLVLCDHWPHSDKLYGQIEQIALTDPNTEVRAVALGKVGVLHKGSNDQRVGAMLAGFVYDERAPTAIRCAAYWALYQLRGLPVFSLYRSGVLKKDMESPHDYDWAFVDTFLQ